jgi:transcriptional regulator GlxA family with amidase domain
MAGQSRCPTLVSVLTPADRSRRLVDQAESLVLANVQAPVEIAALCQALAVSERTLRKAFQKVHRLPPCRRLRWLRLSHARRALMSVGGSSVTEIATGFGFVELGRFSVEYRKIFGERPSETLRQAISKHSLKTYAIGQ